MKIKTITGLLLLAVFLTNCGKNDDKNDDNNNNENGVIKIEWSQTSYPITESSNEIVDQNDKLFSVSNGNVYGLGGVYFSEDVGVNWQKIEYDDNFNSSQLLSNNNRLFASQWGDGIRISDDDGLTWQRTNTDFSIFEIIHYNGDTLYAGGNDGVYVSTDNGQLWNNIGIDQQVMDVAIIDGKLFAATWQGMYKSLVDEISWEEIDQNSGLTAEEFDKLAANENVIFAAEEVMGADKVFLSYDGGDNWTVANGLKYFYEIYFGENYLLAASTDGLYFSNDNGLNWVNIGLTNVQSVYVHSGLIFAGTGAEGIWTTPIDVLL